MQTFKRLAILANLIMLLVLFNGSVLKKEAIVKEGTLILLELAPVDPRSLMQGDYMQLRYKISDENEERTSLAKTGFCVVKQTTDGVAQKIRFQQGKTPLANNEFLIRYNFNGWQITIGAESYFFEEGQSEKYAKAKYGGIKTDREGNGVLVGLYDSTGRKIN